LVPEYIFLIKDIHKKFWVSEEAFNNKMIDDLDKVKIFSYGSNMYSKRHVKRVQSAEIQGIGKAQGFKIEFFKKSKDNSGKATLIRTTNKLHIIWVTISTI